MYYIIALFAIAPTGVNVRRCHQKKYNTIENKCTRVHKQVKNFLKIRTQIQKLYTVVILCILKTVYNIRSKKMDKTAILYNISNIIDLEQNSTNDVYEKLKPYLHNATKTALSRFLHKHGYQRVSVRLNGKFTKRYKYTGNFPQIKIPCDHCNGTGFIIKSLTKA